MPKNRLRLLWNILTVVITVISLIYIVGQLGQSWSQIREVKLSAAPVLLALLLACLGMLNYALLWHNILQRLGAKISRMEAVRIWFLSQIMRYAPGNVWYFLGRSYLAQRVGIKIHPLSQSLVFELLQTLTAALLVTIFSLLFWQEQDKLAWWTLLVIPLIFIFAWPQFLQRLIGWLFRKMGQITGTVTLTRQDLFVLLPGYCFTWISFGIGVYLLTLAMYPLSLSALPTVIGIFALAWVLGFLSFITPSGIGVREGILTYLLAFLMPAHVALLVALLARVWLTVVELGCAAIAMMIGGTSFKD